tara:strand:+ start:78 stop:239 length:162 start_codon:yes stop_codon:yes gene_type:complete
MRDTKTLIELANAIIKNLPKTTFSLPYKMKLKVAIKEKDGERLFDLLSRINKR